MTNKYGNDSGDRQNAWVFGGTFFTLNGEDMGTVIDPITGKTLMIDSTGAAICVPLTLLAGSTFEGTGVDANIWTVTTAGSGSAVQTTGVLALSTGMTASSTAQAQTAITTPFVPGSEILFQAVIVHGTSPMHVITQEWGMFNATTGVFFKLTSAGLSIVSRVASVDTEVAAASWNGPTTFTLTAGMHSYEIRMTAGGTYFLIGGQLVHTLSTAFTPNVGVIGIPVTLRNDNTAGNTVDTALTVLSAALFSAAPILNLQGVKVVTPLVAGTSNYGAITVKSGPGFLAKIIPVVDNAAPIYLVDGVVTNWVTGHAYHVSDIVYPADPQYPTLCFTCTQAHTSSTWAADRAANWNSGAWSGFNLIALSATIGYAELNIPFTYGLSLFAHGAANPCSAVFYYR